MMYAIVVFLVVVGIPIFDYLFRRPVLRALLSCLTPIFYVAVPAAETAYEKMEETYDTLSLSVNDFVEANSPVMMEAREQLRDRLMLLTGSKMPQPNFDAAAAGGDGDAELGTVAAEPPPAAAASPQVPALLPANSPGSDTPKRSLSGRVMASARSFLSPKTLPRPAAAPATSPAPAAAPAAAPEPEDPAPAPAEAEPTYAIGSRVFVKRSSGEEAIAFVTEYDAGMKAYTLELESVGSGKTKRSLENAIRAAPAADAPASDVEA